MSILGSTLYKDMFSTKEMRDVFSDENQVQKWLDVEIALAEAQGELGIIPSLAAREIKSKGKLSNFSLEEIGKGILLTWHPLISMIRQFESNCEPPYGEYIHWGATTQDIMDSGLMLQIREALNLIEGDLKKVIKNTLLLVEKYKDTVMAGRTHGQHGVPLTFGYKAAVWVDELNRHLQRLIEVKKKVNTGNLSGGVGTLASLGEQAVEVRELFFEKLDFYKPDITWHSARDRLSEVVFVIGMIGSTLGKIANEIVNLQKTEVGELEEPFYFGKVGSSTMPQKRNPMASETVVAIGTFLRQHSALIMQSMTMENERDFRVWLIEWEVIPTSFKMISGALTHMEWILKDLQVNEKRMGDNLELTNGLIMAESVFMELSKTIGHQKAHDIVYKIAMQSYENGVSFGLTLMDNKDVNSHLSKTKIQMLLDTSNYIGLSKYFTNKVLKTTVEI